MYILTITAKQKNAKRHIVTKSKDIEELRRQANNTNDKYIKQIYNGKWELIETI